MRATFLLASLALLLAAPAAAQTLTSSALVQGQLATFAAAGFAPGDLVVLLASPLGAGAGPCLEPGPSTCIGLANPILVLASAAAGPAGGASFAFQLPPTIPLVTVGAQGLGVAPAAGGLDFKVTNVVVAPIEPLSSLGDGFEGGALDPSWQVLHPDLCDLAVTGGALELAPHAFTLWFNGSEGPLVFQPVTGDFTVTARLAVSAPGGGAPATEYRLGGLLVRDPSGLPSSPLDWVHLAAGAGDLAHPLAVEHKLTVDSASTYAFVPVADLALELRIARHGQAFDLSYREDAGQAWILAQSYIHPTLPATVDVGLMAYSDHAAPGVLLRCFEIAFGP